MTSSSRTTEDKSILQAQPALLWTILVGIAAAWLYVAPALHRAAFLGHLRFRVFAFDLLRFAPPPSADASTGTYTDIGILTISLLLFVLIPSLLTRRITRWTIIATPIVTLLLFLLGYCDLYWLPPQTAIDLGIASALVVAAFVPALRIAPFPWLASVPPWGGRTTRALGTMMLLADVFALAPATTGRWAARNALPEGPPTFVYLIRMKDHSSFLNEKIVREIYNAPDYVLLQQYVPEQEEEEFSPTKLLSGEHATYPLIPFLRLIMQSPDDADVILPALSISEYSSSFSALPVLVDKSAIEQLVQVPSPEIYAALFSSQISTHPPLRGVVDYSDGVITLRVEPRQSGVVFGISKSPEGDLSLTTRPAPEQSENENGRSEKRP